MAINRNVEKELTIDEDKAKLTKSDVKRLHDGLLFDEEQNITRYDYAVGYKPSKWSLEFFSWVNMIFGKQDNQTPKTHFMLIDHVTSKHQLEQVLAHRGLGKSELVSNFLPLYIAYKGSYPNFGVVNNFVLFSDTISQAQEHLANMRLNYENSEELQKVLTLVETKTIKPKVDVLVFDNMNGNRIFIQAKGAGESMRGTKKGKIRPQLLVFDDILSDDILESEVVRKKLHTWFFSTVSNSVDITHFKYVMINTPMTEADIIGLARVSKAWHTLELPVAMDVHVPLNKMVSSWKDRFTPERIIQKYKEAKSMGAQSQFYREMMLEITNKELALFDMSKIREFDYKELKKNFHKYMFFTSMDLAVSRAESADFTAVMTIAVDSDMNWFLVQVDHGRWDMHETMDVLFEKHIKRFNPLKIGVERAAHQQVFNDFMTNRMVTEQIIKPIVPLKSNSKLAKEVRIATLVPNVSMGKIWFYSRETASKRELYHEMDMMTKESSLSRHDDLVDCLAGFNEAGFVVYPGEYRGTEIVGQESFDFDDYTDNYL